MNLTGTHNLSRFSGFWLSGFWAARDIRERMILTVAAALLLTGLGYALLFYPALAGRTQLSKDLPVLRAQVGLLQALSKEAASLSERPARTVAAPTKENVEAALARNNLKAQNVILSGDLVKVQLDAVSFAGMLNWLDEMQKTALLSVTEANIVALPRPDTVNATLTLRQQRND